MKATMFRANMFLVYFVPYKINIHIYVGDLNKPTKGKFLFDTRENSHIRPNLSEDLQQCTKISPIWKLA
jgi:hypothetical protein